MSLSPRPCHDDRRSLRTGFERAATTSPAAPALVVKDVTLSYAEVDRTARTWARALLNVSRGRTERVSVRGA